MEFLKVIFRLINKIVAVIFLLTMLVFLFLVFEIPIPIISEKISQYVSVNYKDDMPKDSQFSVGAISLSWNYTIKRPIILIKKILYKTPSNEIYFDSLGVYPDLYKLIFDNKFSIRKLYLDGFNFIIVEQKGKLQFDLMNNNKKNINKNQEDPIKYTIDVKNLYGSIKEVKKSIPMLQQINEIAFKNLNLTIEEEQSSSVLVIDSLTIADTKSGINFSLISRLDLEGYDISNVDAKLNLLPNNDVSIKSKITNLELSKIIEKLYPYYPKIKQVKIEKLPINMNIYANYNMETGIKDFDFSINVKQGKFFYSTFFEKPFNLKSLNAMIKYDKAQNVIDLYKFEAKFDKNTNLFFKTLGSSIPLEELKANVLYNLDDGSININKASLFNSFNSIDFNLSLSDDASFSVIKADILAKNLNEEYLKNAFPSKLNSKLKQWIEDSIHNVDVENISVQLQITNDKVKNTINIDSLTGNSLIKNANLNYLPKMPILNVDEVNISFDKYSMLAIYKELSTYSLISKNGTLEIFDYSKAIGYQPSLRLNMELLGNPRDAIAYIDHEPLMLAQKYSINPQSFNGIANGKLMLEYYFDTAKMNDINIDLKLTNFTYANVFKNFDATEGNIDFKLTKNGLKALGDVVYLGEKANVDITFDWDNKNLSIFDISLDRFDIKTAYKLNMLPTNLLDKVSGYAKVKMLYKNYNNNVNLDFDVNLLESQVDVFELNYKKELDKPFSVVGSLTQNDGLTNINKLFITSENFNTSMKLSLGESLTQIDIDNFKVNNNFDFNGNILLSNNDIRVFLKGNKIDVANLLPNSKKDSKTDSKADDRKTNENNTAKDIKQEESKNYYIDVDIARVYNLDKYIKNMVFKLDISDGTLKNVLLNASFDTREESYIIFNSNQGLINAKIYNFGYLLEFFKFSNALKKGDLEANILIKNMYNTKTSKKTILSQGNITLNSFVAGISFTSALVNFKGENYYFDLQELQLTGNILGGKMSGYLDMENKYLDISGKLIPIWSANQLISNTPFVKKLLDKKDGLIDFNASVKGNLGELEYSLFKNTKSDSNFKKDIAENELLESTKNEEADAGELLKELTNNEELGQLDTLENTITDTAKDNLNNPNDTKDLNLGDNKDSLENEDANKENNFQEGTNQEGTNQESINQEAINP
jgi:hypothetical protein